MSKHKYWPEMKPAQRDRVAEVIVTAGIALTSNRRPQIWRDTMKNESTKVLGRVRRFYRYLASFDDVQKEAIK